MLGVLAMALCAVGAGGAGAGAGGAKVQADAAIAKAHAWLDTLAIDPIELRRHGIKGKKKLVELLDAYATLLKIAPSETDRRAILRRVKEVALVTVGERYHDMLLLADEEFKQDATSYLRAAVLLERMGFVTTQYRAEIKKIGARLNEHMKTRGPNQRRIFHDYYRFFGLKEPFPLAGALEEGVIAHRSDPKKMSFLDAYQLTHEIFAVFEYGEKRDADPWSKDDKAYIRQALDVLAERSIERLDVDLTGELVTCAVYMKAKDSAAYQKGLDLLLRSQNADGTWGAYEAETKKMGEWAKPGFYLHTTTVAIEALAAAFHS